MPAVLPYSASPDSLRLRVSASHSGDASPVCDAIACLRHSREGVNPERYERYCIPAKDMR